MEPPEIYVIAGRNDGPPALPELDFRRDYLPRAKAVQAHVDTPRGVTLGRQGDLGEEYVTFWMRQPRDATFLAREVHLWETNFTAVSLRCVDGAVR